METFGNDKCLKMRFRVVARNDKHTGKVYEELQDSYDISKLCYCKGINEEGIIDLDSDTEDKIKKLRPTPHKQTYAYPRKKLVKIAFEDKEEIVVEDGYWAVDHFNEMKKRLKEKEK